MATTRAIFELTVQYCRDRNAFDEPITEFQHVRFELAEMATEIDVAEAYQDRSVLAYDAGTLNPIDAAKGNWYVRTTEACHGSLSPAPRWLRVHVRIRCRQAYVDTRIQTICGGTTEIMKELIGRDLVRDR